MFENVSIDVSMGERVALIGKNGVGKTSLIAGLMGRTAFDAGSVHRSIPVDEWGWIEQELKVAQGLSLLEFVHGGREDLFQMKQRMDALLRRLELGETDERVVEDFGACIHSYTSMGGYEFEIEMEKALKRLGLDADMWDVPYQNLSGGQKTRAQFARLAVGVPRFLLLDEPTNHLDAETLEWLQGWLKSYSGAVLFVSHDRSFIDAVAHTTYELTAKGTKRYKGGYSAFRQARDIEIRTQTVLYEKQQREKQALLEAIQQYKEWYERAHNAASERDPFGKKRAQKNSTRFKAKERALDRLEKDTVERPHEGFKVETTLSSLAFDAKTLVRLEDVGFSYPQREMFRNVGMEIRKSDRVGVIGPNGVGKSTFLKLMSGQYPPSRGMVYHHPQTRIGYFAQELDALDLSKTILESVLELPGMTLTYARTVLASFLFRDEDVFKPIGDLSMGERCRVAFVNLYLSSANLLVLDEPTNYLDIDTRERIEDALMEYPGALVVVSHDRYLLKKLVNRVVYFDGLEVRTFEGTYDSFGSRLSANEVGIDVANEISSLELKLTQLMATDVHLLTDPAQLIEEIRRVRSRLDTLQGASRFNENHWPEFKE